jgi:hypothetical protein
MNKLKLKLIFITLLFFISGITIDSFAQFQAGVRVGGNASNFVGDDVDQDNSMHKLGVNTGVFVFYNINPGLALQIGANYTMKGREVETAYKGILINFDYNQTDKLNYFNIPVLARVNFGDELKIHLNAGPSFNFLINSDSEYEITSGNENIDIEQYLGEMEYDYPGTDIGILFGAGITNNSLMLDFRYEFGMQSVVDSDDAPDMKNSVFTLSLGYMIN